MSSSLSLHAEGITVSYDHKVVLRELNFHAAPGELTVLVGPNGCGKSTLLKSLARVLSLDTGRVMLADRDVHKTSTKAIAKMLAFLPQGPLAPEGLKVRELVAQGRFPHQNLLRQWSLEDAEIVATALQQTNLTTLADRPLSDLSGGQRQRAWIAMTLAQNTPAILLDEPTAFLDLKVQVELLALLRNIAHQQQRTVVVVLHDLNIAASFADRMLMLRDGDIAAAGTVAEVFNRDNLKAVFDLDTSILLDPNSGRPMCAPKYPDLTAETR